MSTDDDQAATMPTAEEMALLESSLQDDPRTTAFFLLLDPYVERANEIPLAMLHAMVETGAPIATLAKTCDLLIRLSAAGGPLANVDEHRKMRNLRMVLDRLERLPRMNAAGGAA